MTRSLRDSRMLIAAAALSFVLVSAFVLQTSFAAFSDTTRNDGNTWEAGTVVLDDDAPLATAMFTAENLAPTDTVENCIVVTYSGTLVDADLRLYAENFGGDLGQYLDTTVQIGTGGQFGDCTNFVSDATLFTGTFADFVTAHGESATGLDAFTYTETPESVTFRIETTLQDDNDAQGDTLDADFVWEVENV